MAERHRHFGPGLSLYLLSLALKSLPVGTAYAIWVGTGTFGVALMGIIALGEKASWQKFVFLALMLAGMIGLKMIETTPEPETGSVAVAEDGWSGQDA